MTPCPTALRHRFIGRSRWRCLMGLAALGACLSSAAQPTLITADGPLIHSTTQGLPVLVDEMALARAPRIVATADGRVLLGPGDRAYVQGTDSLLMPPGSATAPGFRVLRAGMPLKDPATGAVLGHEVPVVGRAVLVRAEPHRTATGTDSPPRPEPVLATIEIVQAREDIRVGDHLLPEPAADDPLPATQVPYAVNAVAGQIVSVSGSARSLAAQDQLVVINRGRAHGLEPGHVLTVLYDSRTLHNPGAVATKRLPLPDEPKGQIRVSRSFEQLSYARVLQTRDAVRVGDRFTHH